MTTYLPTVAGMMLSSVPATARHGLIIGSTGGGPPDGTVAFATYLQDMQLLGATMGRTYLSANFINTSAGVYDFAYRQGAPDLWVSTSLAAAQTLILQDVFGPNFWFQGSPTHSAQPYTDSPIYSATPGSDWDYWLTNRTTWLTRAAQQYPDPRIIWELGNEMNVPGIYWHYNYSATTACTPQAYADYFMRGTAAIKAVNPAQKVIIGGLLRVDSATSGLSGIAFMQQLQPFFAAAGFTPDGVSLHPYMLGASNSDPTIDRGPNAIGVNSSQSTGRFLAALDALGYYIPVHLTEIGFRASQTNAQGAFNCNSEGTKSLWNRYEHDSAYCLYTKDARGANKSWVESILYYRDQEYPSPTTPTYAAAISGDPPQGPHTLTTWGSSLQDFTNRVTNRLTIPKLEGWTFTCPATAVIGQSPITISATGTGIGAIPTFKSSDPTVALIATPPTGSSSTTVTFPGSGTIAITVQSMTASRLPITAVQRIVVAAQIAQSSSITPANGWQVATSNNGTIQFVATAVDQINNPIVSPPGTWSSSDATNFPIDPVTGLGTAIGVATGVVITFAPTGGVGGSSSTSTGNVTLNPVLQIIAGPSQLLAVGATPISVTDGAVAVTGVTLIISDASKATATGQDLFGKGTSGTFTLTARKTGYGDSSPLTITCTTGAVYDDKDAIGQANGTTVSSYTDLGSNTWADASNGPTYLTNIVNGHNVLSFNGSSSKLRANAAVTQLNGVGYTYASLIYPTNATPSINEHLIDNRDATNSQGAIFGRNSTTTPFLFYYTAVGTLTQRFDGTTLIPANSWTRFSNRVSTGSEQRMLNGTVVGTSGTDAYRNPTTAPIRPTKGASQFTANFYQGYMALEIYVNRAVTNEEWGQIDYRIQLYQGTPVNPATLDHLDLLISSTTATIGSGAPTLTVQKWADAAETTPSTATVTLGYVSNTPATATVNATTGVITLVAPGTTTFTVTDSISGKNATSPTLTVSGSGSVTAVKLYLNGQDVSTYNGLLLFTGNAYTVTAKDQSGNTLSSGSGTWASTDVPNAPVSSGGVMTPGAGINTVPGVLTFTHAASGKVGSAPFSVLTTPPAIFKQMGSPANTTALMAQISSGLTTDAAYNSGLPVPTGTGSPLISDGGYVNHFAIDSTTPGRQFMGKAGMVNILSATTPPRTAELKTLSGSFMRSWGLQIIRFDPGFTSVGVGGGAAAFKWGNWFNFSTGPGRVGPEQTNGDAPTGTIDNYCSVVTPAGGYPTGDFQVGGLSTEYTAGETWVSLLLYETRGNNIMSSRWGWFKIGDVPSTPFGGITVEGPMQGGASRTGAPPAILQYEPSTVNYNRAPPPADQGVTIFDWMLVDGDTYGDPFGVLAPVGVATPTLTGITGGTVTHGTSSASVVLTGTGFNANCEPLFSNAKIYPQTITINSSTQMTVVVAVDATATTGLGTVLVKNKAIPASSGTQVVLVV